MKQNSVKQCKRKRGVVTYSPKRYLQISENKQFAQISFLIFIGSYVFDPL